MKLVNTVLSAAAGAVIAGIAFDKYTNGLVSKVIKDAIDPSDEEDTEEEVPKKGVTEVEDEDKKNENSWFSENDIVFNSESNKVIIGANAFTGLFKCFVPQHNEKGIIPIMIKGYNGVGFVMEADDALRLYSMLERVLESRSNDSKYDPKIVDDARFYLGLLEQAGLSYLANF